MNMTMRRETAKRGGRLLLAALLAVGLMAAPVLAARSTSASFLKLGAGARAAGMGDAYTALADDASGLYWNTAGLAGLQRKQFIFMHNDWFGSINYEYLGYVHPLANGSVVGGSFTYVDKGEIPRTTYGNPFGSGLGSFTASDFAWGLAYAYPYSANIDFGAMGKLIYQKLDDATATSFAVDLGMQYKNLYPGLTLGAGVYNLGTAATFDSKKEQLPLMFKAGAAYRFAQFPLTLSSDLVMLRGDESSFRFGAEYEVMRFIDLRAGYNSANDADNGFGLGFGINMDDLQINYAYVPYGDLGNTHRIDSVFTFGDIVGAPAPPVVTPPVSRPTPPVTPPVTQPQPPVTQPVSPPPTPAADVAGQVRELIARGNRQQTAGDAAGAAQTYLAALRVDPLSYAAYYNLGNAVFALKDYQAAKSAYTYALTVKPGALEAMTNLGSALYKLQDFAGAAKLWETALRRDPANQGARHNLDILYQRHPEARGAAIGPVPSVPETLLTPAAAAPAAPAAVSAPTAPAAGGRISAPPAPALNVPPAPPILTNAPVLSLPTPAVRTGAPPAVTAPAAPAVISSAAAQLVMRGNELARQGDHRGAVQLYQQALQQDPRSYSAYYNLGNAAYMLHEYAAARAAYEAALQLKPGSMETMNNLAGALYKLKEYVTAARLWEQVLAVDPQNAATRANLDKVYERHPESRPAR